MLELPRNGENNSRFSFVRMDMHMAFLEAFKKLQRRRDAGAFYGWFRRIVYKHCDRRLRRKGFHTISDNETVDTGTSWYDAQIVGN